jgi:hypothetical protein
MKFHENPSSGSRVIARGWTDRFDEAESRFLQPHEYAWKRDMYERYTISVSLRAIQQNCLYSGVMQ